MWAENPWQRASLAAHGKAGMGHVRLLLFPRPGSC